MAAVHFEQDNVFVIQSCLCEGTFWSGVVKNMTWKTGWPSFKCLFSMIDTKLGNCAAFHFCLHTSISDWHLYTRWNILFRNVDSRFAIAICWIFHIGRRQRFSFARGRVFHWNTSYPQLHVLSIRRMGNPIKAPMQVRMDLSNGCYK